MDDLLEIYPGIIEMIMAKSKERQGFNINGALLIKFLQGGGIVDN